LSVGSVLVLINYLSLGVINLTNSLPTCQQQITTLFCALTSETPPIYYVVVRASPSH